MTAVVIPASIASGIRAGSSIRRAVRVQRGLVNIAIDTIRQKKACAVPACATAIGSGNSSSTVIPPRIACTMMRPNAAMTVLRTQRRGSTRHAHAIRMSVSVNTVAAATRCPNSKRIPPCHAGMSLPKASGQSGTASAEPVEVTRPPTKIRQKVAPAASRAKRCNARSRATEFALSASVIGRARPQSAAAVSCSATAHCGR